MNNTKKINERRGLSKKSLISNADDCSYQTLKCQKTINENPLLALEECQKAWKSLKTRFRQSRYELLAIMLGISYALRKNEDLQNEFLSNHFFLTNRNQYNIGSRKHLARSIVGYVLNRKCGQSESTVSKYAAVLLWLIAKNIPPANAVKAIETEGGIAALHRAQSKKQKKPQTINSSILTVEAHKDPEIGNLSEQIYATDIQCFPDDNLHRDNSKTCTRKTVGARRPIEVRMNSKRRRRILRMHEGESATIEIVCSGRDDKGWLLIEGKRVIKKGNLKGP